MKLEDWGFHFEISRCINESFIARTLSSGEGDDLEFFEAQFALLYPGTKEGLSCASFEYFMTLAVQFKWLWLRIKALVKGRCPRPG